MSKGNTLLIVIIILAIAGLGVWWYSSGRNAGSPPSASSGTSVADTSLTQDLSAIDGQISAFGSDTASVNAGLSDQQVAQSSL